LEDEKPGEAQLPDGSFDDGAMRGAGLFLTIGLPVCYLVASCYYAAVAHVLVRFKRLTLKASLWVAGLAPWLLVLLAMAGLISNNRSILPGLLMLGIIGLFMSLFTILGALAWWFIAIPRAPSNPSFKRDALKRAP